jgi:DtxR family Mn-dependent transcriptional regulator
MRTHTSGHESAEMYLKTIAEMESDGNPVSVPRLADRLGISPVSAGEMVRRLAGQELITSERYRGVTLTDKGRYAAHSVIRRQRLWECFLADHLNMEWAGVYEMACRLEHATSNVLAESLSAWLGHPEFCPYGNPIPRRDGTVAVIPARPLTALRVGESGHIQSIQPAEIAVFAWLQQHQVLPGRPFTVTAIAPLDGPLTLDLAGNQVTIGRSLAELVRVQTG